MFLIMRSTLASSASVFIAMPGSIDHGMRDTAFSDAGYRRDAPYIKAALGERDKLLAKPKNTCSGC